MSAIGRFFSPSAPRVRRPKVSPSLERLSLSQLTELRTGARKRKTKLSGELAGLDVVGEDTQEGPFAALGTARKRKRLTRQLGRTSTRLGDITTARQRFIKRGTAARAGRATAISTLLGRGI